MATRRSRASVQVQLQTACGLFFKAVTRASTKRQSGPFTRAHLITSGLRQVSWSPSLLWRGRPVACGLKMPFLLAVQIRLRVDRKGKFASPSMYSQSRRGSTSCPFTHSQESLSPCAESTLSSPVRSLAPRKRSAIKSPESKILWEGEIAIHG
jgi:hypothetical protein